MGQDAPEIVALRSIPEIRVALVPLTEAEAHKGMMKAASVDAPDNMAGYQFRDRMHQIYDLYEAIRDPNDLSQHVFDSPEQMTEELEPVDINHLGDLYQRMIEDSSPALDGLSAEQLDELKKALEKIDWSVLSGKPWWHLRNFFMTIPAELLQGKSLGFFSNTSLIGKTDSRESIPGA